MVVECFMKVRMNKSVSYVNQVVPQIKLNKIVLGVEFFKSVEGRTILVSVQEQLFKIIMPATQLSFENCQRKSVLKKLSLKSSLTVEQFLCYMAQFLFSRFFVTICCVAKDSLFPPFSCSIYVSQKFLGDYYTECMRKMRNADQLVRCPSLVFKNSSFIEREGKCQCCLIYIRPVHSCYNFEILSPCPRFS